MTVTELVSWKNTATLRCEKPMPIEPGFTLARPAEPAREDAAGERRPWKAAHAGDDAWLGDVIAKHYGGRTVVGVKDERADVFAEPRGPGP